VNSPRTIQIGGRSIEYSVHLSSRARRLSLRLDPRSGLVFVVPHRWRLDALNFETFLRERRTWVFRALDRAARLERSTPKPTFTDGSTFSVLGKETTLRVLCVEKKRTVVKMVGNELLVRTATVNPDHIHAALTAWFRYAAGRIIPERVEQLNAPLGFRFKNVIVRDQKSRWGSCSRRGTLSFNWRLLLVPPSVMDYLIFHELAHVQEMNHSIRFWRLVQKLCPTFRESERWLKRHGNAMFW
jgi:predicted metal-dependent hydrolase